MLNSAQQQITYHCAIIKSEAGPPRAIHSRTTSVTIGLWSPWLLGRCSLQLRESCADINMVYKLSDRMFILNNFFTSK
jgi:hypothetical protein